MDNKMLPAGAYAVPEDDPRWKNPIVHRVITPEKGAETMMEPNKPKPAETSDLDGWETIRPEAGQRRPGTARLCDRGFSLSVDLANHLLEKKVGETARVCVMFHPARRRVRILQDPQGAFSIRRGNKKVHLGGVGGRATLRKCEKAGAKEGATYQARMIQGGIEIDLTLRHVDKP